MLKACFAGTEESQAERHDQGTIDEVQEDQDVEEGGDAMEEANREAYLLEQIPIPGRPESEKELLASWPRLPRRARVPSRRLHRNLRHLPKEALVQMLRAARAYKIISMLRRHFDVRVVTTQGQDPKHTKCHHLDPQRLITKWSRCVRDY